MGDPNEVILNDELGGSNQRANWQLRQLRDAIDICKWVDSGFVPKIYMVQKVRTSRFDSGTDGDNCLCRKIITECSCILLYCVGLRWSPLSILYTTIELLWQHGNQCFQTCCPELGMCLMPKTGSLVYLIVYSYGC